jgi:hypothetical protein
MTAGSLRIEDRVAEKLDVTNPNRDHVHHDEMAVLLSRGTPKLAQTLIS